MLVNQKTTCTKPSNCEVVNFKCFKVQQWGHFHGMTKHRKNLTRSPSEKMKGLVKRKGNPKIILNPFELDGYGPRYYALAKDAEGHDWEQRLTTWLVVQLLEDWRSNLRTLPMELRNKLRKKALWWFRLCDFSSNTSKNDPAPAVQRAGLTQCCLSTAQGQTARPKPRWF